MSVLTSGGSNFCNMQRYLSVEFWEWTFNNLIATRGCESVSWRDGGEVGELCLSWRRKGGGVNIFLDYIDTFNKYTSIKGNFKWK